MEDDFSKFINSLRPWNAVRSQRDYTEANQQILEELARFYELARNR